MHKFGEWIVKYRVILLVIAIVLLIPSAIGMARTRVNYDILTYLPEDNETIQGQNILKDEFGMGAYSMILIDDLPEKQILEFEDKLREMDNVSMVASVVDILGEGVPKEILPDQVKDAIYKDGSTVMMVTFKDGISTDKTLDTVEEIREIADDKFEVTGMTAVLLDTKYLSESELTAYVIIAVILCLIVLQIALDSFAAPIFLLLNIGFAILYNMGTNYFLGEVSYITKAIAAVLQLGVTTDFAIFLYHAYMRNREEGKENKEAMANAISETLGSVFGSSITTIAGFLALCGMELTLGKDIGIVMAKGVLFGLICVVTVLPAMILCFGRLIDKTKHKSIMPEFKHLKRFILKFHWLIIIVFIIVLPIAFHGYQHTEVYYNLDSKLPKDLDSVQANEHLNQKFNLATIEMLLVDSNLDSEELNEMIGKIEEVNGVDWALGISKIEELGIPKMMIPTSILEKIQTDQYGLILISSTLEVATDEMNEQLTEINDIVVEYDDKAILAGVAPLLDDLAEIAGHDFNIVNTVSIGVIFVIMLFVLKSISLPFILMIVIEFAIFINMGIPYYRGIILPFIASIVIGTIQLGATIDYAILITSKYINMRKSGKNKQETIDYALGTSISAIFTSGLCFFAATFGVGMYSKIEIISSLCVLLGRGAIISMFAVVMLLPSFLLVFDKLICKTTADLRKREDVKNENN
ncbi:MAG: MMPL family transporter [Clostridia bacterium]|nr:MMPL family transporter [Clostridia bacterium]